MSLTTLYCEEAALIGVSTDIESYLQVKSRVDRVLLHDERVLWNMLKREKNVVKVDYCAVVQSEIKPHMRKIVVDWMLEVCQDQQCQPQVFHLSLNYLDRFLSQKRIKKTQFQLVGTVCIFLASKMCECAPITAEKLLVYTDNSVTLEELLHWEMLVLATLKWELSAVTPLSFLEHFENRTSVRKATLDFPTIQRHADHLLTIMATEYQYLLIQPSLLAAAALSAAVSGLISSRQDKKQVAADQLVKELSQLIQRPTKELDIVTESIETLLDRHREMMSFRSKLASQEQEPAVIYSAEYYTQSVL